ncbi:MAG: transcriptional regulator [Phycisphaerae bacterium]|nr:transcriptional regulator [Phycisphaerae bacterium]
MRHTKATPPASGAHPRGGTQAPGLQVFLARHPVFTGDELAQFHERRGSGTLGTLRVLLSRQRARGRVLSVRRGVYAVVPLGMDSESAPVDPYLVASRLARDSVLAYHTALELHGHAQSAFTRYQFLTRTAARACTFRSAVFQPVRVPRALAGRGGDRIGVQTMDRMGLDLRVTTLERTCVDALDRPDLCGGWEEVVRSLESVPSLDLEAVVAYALRLRSATLAAKVGWFLELNAKRLDVPERAIRRLRSRAPKSRQYLDRGSRRGHRLASGWNLMLPTPLAERRWSGEA